MELTIAICEDEENIAAEIKRLVKNDNPDFEVDCYASGEDFIVADRKYDICFLDIQMPGRNGLEIAAQIRSKADYSQTVIIFITALKEHMQAAFDVQAYHFLCKPLDEGQFNTVLHRAAKDCAKKKDSRSMIVKQGGISCSVALNDILFVESNNKKVIIHTLRDRIEYYGKISDFEKTAGFFRCHRCYIVNLAHIVRYNATTVWVDNGTAISLAQTKYQEFITAYMQFAAG